MIKIEYEAYIAFSGKTHNRGVVTTQIGEIIKQKPAKEWVINQIGMLFPSIVDEYVNLCITSELENDNYKMFISNLTFRKEKAKLTSVIFQSKDEIELEGQKYRFDGYTSHEALDANVYLAKDISNMRKLRSYNVELENKLIEDTLINSLFEKVDFDREITGQLLGTLQSESYGNTRGYCFMGSRKGFISDIEKELRKEFTLDNLDKFIGYTGDIVDTSNNIFGNIGPLGNMKFKFGALEIGGGRHTIIPEIREELTPDDHRKGSQFTTLLDTKIVEGRYYPADKKVLNSCGTSFVISKEKEVKF